MFDNIKKGLAKAAPWFCYVEEVQPSNVVSFEDLKKKREEQIAAQEKETRNTATKKFVSVDTDAPIPEGYVHAPEKTIWELEEGEEVPEGFQRINDHECVQLDPNAVDPHSFKGFVKDVTKKVKDTAKFVGKIFVEVVPVNEETPIDLASQVIDAAVTSANSAMFAGAAAMVTAKYSLPIQLVSGLIAFFAATKVTDKWKKEIIHPAVEGYKGKLKTVCAAQHIDPEINMAFETLVRDGATQDECLEAVNTIMDAAYPTDEEQNEVFMMCKGNVGKMINMASEVIEAKALEENKFYTEFLNKPFVEQKWFVKVKNWCKKIKESFADSEVRHTLSKMLRGLGIGLCLTGIATLNAGPAWPIVFLTGLAASCGLMASGMADSKVEKIRNFLAGAAIYIAEIVISFDIIKLFTAAKESACNA